MHLRVLRGAGLPYYTSTWRVHDDDNADDDDDGEDDGDDEGNDDDDNAGNRSSNLVCPGRAGEPVHLRKPLLLLLTKLANGIQYSILSQSTQKYQKYLEVPRGT